MSGHTRQVFKSAVVTAAAPLPYYETIGQVLDLNKAADYWVTLEFPPTIAERVSLGFPACYRESGAVILHVLGRSGQGDQAVFNYAEQIRPHFDGPFLVDVRLKGTYPPALFPTDNGEWLDVTTVINYEWDYVVAGVTS